MFAFGIHATAIVAVLVLSGLSRPSLAYVAVDLEPTSSSGTDPQAYTNHGWEFTVDVPIVVTHLGLFDDDDDGFDIAHLVGLWRVSDSTRLSMALIGVGTANPLLDHFRYADIVDVSLAVGETYVIGFYSSTTNQDAMILNAGDLQVHPFVNITQALSTGAGGGFLMPDTPCSGDRFGPNFQFIPEPAMLVLLGLSSVILLRRRTA